jgi:ABC-type phosphate transport system ATPase subunit
LVDNIPKKATVDKKQKECLQAIMIESDGGKSGFERALERLRDLIDDIEVNE